MQLWVGALGAVVATLLVVLTGPAVARWASGVDVRLPVRVSAATAAVAGFVVGAQVGLEPALAAFLVLAVAAALLVGIDLRLHRLPDRLTGWSAVIGLIGLAVAAVVDGAWTSSGRAVLAGLAYLGTYLLLFLVVRSGLGAGDVKLAGTLGLHLGWLGWPTLVLGAFTGVLVGGLVSLALLMTRRANLQTRVPFGPSMIVGALVAIALGDPSAASLLGWSPAPTG